MGRTYGDVGVQSLGQVEAICQSKFGLIIHHIIHCILRITIQVWCVWQVNINTHPPTSLLQAYTTSYQDQPQKYQHECRQETGMQYITVHTFHVVESHQTSLSTRAENMIIDNNDCTPTICLFRSFNRTATAMQTPGN